MGTGTVIVEFLHPRKAVERPVEFLHRFRHSARLETTRDPEEGERPRARQHDPFKKFTALHGGAASPP